MLYSLEEPEGPVHCDGLRGFVGGHNMVRCLLAWGNGLLRMEN